MLDLVEALPQAKQRLPKPDSHKVIDATISGDTRKAILIQDQAAGRIKYDVTIPERAWLKLGIGMLERSWTEPGDGVTVYVYVTPLGPDGQVQFSPEGTMIADELLSLTVNPYGNPADKLWHDLTLSLEKYAGKRVEITLVNRPGPTPAGVNTDGDWLVWGSPRVVVN